MVSGAVCALRDVSTLLPSEAARYAWTSISAQTIEEVEQLLDLEHNSIDSLSATQMGAVAWLACNAPDAARRTYYHDRWKVASAAREYWAEDPDWARLRAVAVGGTCVGIGLATIAFGAYRLVRCMI